MIPLKDNLRYTSLAWVSLAILTLNVLVFIFEMTFDATGQMQTIISSWLPVRAVITDALTTGDPFLIMRCIFAMFAAMFLHANFGHIIGNMCFFFAFAPALEARMGHGKFLLFYLASGWAASLTFVGTDTSGIAHILGASGAIGGVLGAYVIYFPRARIDGLSGTFTFITTLAVFFLAEYVLMQWMMLWSQLGGAEEAAGVAFSAHIGGMGFGMLIAALMLVGDARRWRWRDLLFYAITIGGIVAASITGFSNTWPGLATVIGGDILIWVLFFQAPFNGWWKRLGTPLSVILIAEMISLAVNRLVAAAHRDMGLLQSVDLYAVALIVILLSVVIALSARRLPLRDNGRVTVPLAKEKDRLLSEVVADLVVSFFRFLGLVFRTGCAYAMVGCSYALRWASLIAAVIADFYREYAPTRVQASFARVAAAAKNQLQVWSARFARIGRALRLDRLSVRLFIIYVGLRNRLAVTGS